MGRKSQSKHNSKKSSGKETSKFVSQKRNELAVLVDKLLKLSSILKATADFNKTEHHLQIYALIKDIIKVESILCNLSEENSRQLNIESYLKWLSENGAEFEGIEIKEFEGYELGLKATKSFKEGSLILTVPSKVMMTVNNAKESELQAFISVDPLLQNMPNITLALFLLLEKNNPESFWRPYIEVLPKIYSTVLYFDSDELFSLKPSPVLESSLKLYRSIARQYAYFYNKIHSLDLPVVKKLRDIFTFDSYRWAVSTVMTRQNNIQMSNVDITGFIPLWDMCNHEHGKITTMYNKVVNKGQCYALRDFHAGEQIFIFYGVRPNADLFLHNGFVYRENHHDSLSLSLGVSQSDPLREPKMTLLGKLGLLAVTHYNLYRGDSPLSAELLAFIRIFNMNQEELTQWATQGLPGDLVSSDPQSSAAVGPDVDRRAFTYLLTRCRLIKASYKKDSEDVPDSLHRRNINLLKECEVQILEGAINYLEKSIQTLPTTVKQ